MSSSSLSRKKVDVFLSFWSEESNVYFDNALFRKGIKTFRSYKCLETSVIPINQQTKEALEEAKVAVVRIFKRKPYTVGFLEEVRVILEFQAKGSLKVIPILETSNRFLEVEEEICQKYLGNVQIWKTALTKLVNIAEEYPISLNFSIRYESDRLKQMIEYIYLLLVYSTSSDMNVPVAMDRHMKVVYDLLASEVNEEVRIIGIWGSTGVGKTTLARYIYAEISDKFQTCVFVENVENMKDKILEFEGEEDPSVIKNLDGNGHEIIEARRKHRKVLLIADDVSNIEQGKWIIEYANWFAPGSRVILISEDENLLVDARVKHIYEVRSLRYDEALQLFSHFAFEKPNPPSEFEQLAVRAVHLAGFLPLALRLFGSFLTGKTREDWLAALHTLQLNQGGDIMEVWKLMETLGDKGQEELEAAGEIMEDKDSTAKDKRY